MSNISSAVLFAGIPALNAALYHRIRFLVGDPAACLTYEQDGQTKSLLILRDIEMGRAKDNACVDEVYCPADFAPAEGLSGDRETATAQALAACVLRKGIQSLTTDRTLPFIYVEHLQKAGIEVCYDCDLGVSQRRRKDAQEIEWLREAQAVTERTMAYACETIARATANTGGELSHEGSLLTSERMRELIDIFLLGHGYASPTSIVASGKCGGDCHALGTGIIHTGVPVIVDIFPRNKTTLYNGDCTRTVVHGEVSDRIAKMHAAVVAAKTAATRATKAGVTGQAVHEETSRVIVEHGFTMGLADENSPANYCAMTHGTGHGIGLEVHEPPLLDKGGPALVIGDALTIEPGLYQEGLGGVRVEDMVIVTETGCENLNKLPEGLNWE